MPPTGDFPPNGYWQNTSGSQIYIGDPIPNDPDSAGNQPLQWVQPGQPVQIPSVFTPPAPFTITYTEPNDGDIRWNIALDAAEIYEGKSQQWVPILTAQQLKDIYGEVKQVVANKSSFDERFRDIIQEAEGIQEEDEQERKKKEYVAEMMTRVKSMVLEALEEWAKQQQKQKELPPYLGQLIHTSGQIVYGNHT